VFGISFVDAHSTMELMKSVRMVDVPSNQRRWLDLDSLMRTSDSRGVIYH
jgi:hypothetical protein